LAVGCGGSGSGPESSGPTSPSGNAEALAPNPCQSSSQTCPALDTRGFWIRIQANTSGAPGPWSFTFNQKDYDGSGNTEIGFINAPLGDYEIKGQFSTTAFTVTFLRQGGGRRGGVLPSSVQNLEGPSAPASQCSATYFSRTPPQTFRIKFTVVADTSGTC
jgi:hypothetical protein